MNIVFISNLPDTLSAGPVWSVPARVLAQSKFDNVLWINTSNVYFDNWKTVSVYHNYKEYGKASILVLPPPFNRPDLVVFEGFYNGMKEIRYSIECRLLNIPYIIVPRGSLSWNAMHNHSRKKKEIAHLLFYDSFVKHSLAIQFLTNQEYLDSKYRFDYNHIIIPNGISKQERVKTSFVKDRIEAVFIGRIDIHHKGLDLLLDAIENNFAELMENKFHLSIYGPESEDSQILRKRISNNMMRLVSICGEIHGEKKRRTLLEADIFFLTSRFEGHPMGLIEALSYGLPALITEGSNMASEVKEFRCGFVSDNTVEGISSSLKSMLMNKDVFDVMSQNALELADTFSWPLLAKQFHDEVSSLLQGGL